MQKAEPAGNRRNEEVGGGSIKSQSDLQRRVADPNFVRVWSRLPLTSRVEISFILLTDIIGTEWPKFLHIAFNERSFYET